MRAQPVDREGIVAYVLAHPGCTQRHVADVFQVSQGIVCETIRAAGLRDVVHQAVKDSKRIAKTRRVDYSAVVEYYKSHPNIKQVEVGVFFGITQSQVSA